MSFSITYSCSLTFLLSETFSLPATIFLPTSFFFIQYVEYPKGGISASKNNLFFSPSLSTKQAISLPFQSQITKSEFSDSKERRTLTGSFLSTPKVLKRRTHCWLMSPCCEPDKSSKFCMDVSIILSEIRFVSSVHRLI